MLRLNELGFCPNSRTRTEVIGAVCRINPPAAGEYPEVQITQLSNARSLVPVEIYWRTRVKMGCYECNLGSKLLAAIAAFTLSMLSHVMVHTISNASAVMHDTL